MNHPSSKVTHLWKTADLACLKKHISYLTTSLWVSSLTWERHLDTTDSLCDITNGWFWWLCSLQLFRCVAVTVVRWHNVCQLALLCWDSAPRLQLRAWRLHAHRVSPTPLTCSWARASHWQPQVAPQKLILWVRPFVCFFPPHKTEFNAGLLGVMIKEGGGAEWMLEKMGVSERVYHQVY